MSSQANLHVQITGSVPHMTVVLEADLRNAIRKAVFDVLECVGGDDCVLTIRGPEVVFLKD